MSHLNKYLISNFEFWIYFILLWPSLKESEYIAPNKTQDNVAILLQYNGSQNQVCELVLFGFAGKDDSPGQVMINLCYVRNVAPVIGDIISVIRWHLG